MQKKIITILQEIITKKTCMFSVFFTFILLSLYFRMSGKKKKNFIVRLSKVVKTE